MSSPYVRDLVLLFTGDLVVFAWSLWLALFARHFVAPNSVEYLNHAIPFAVLFVLSLLVFASVGLYDRTVALFEDRLPSVILEAQLVNLGLAVAFFFLAPISIQPKTILVLYFVISTALIVVWRLGIFKMRSIGRENGRTLIVGYGPDIEELVEAVRQSPNTSLEFTAFVNTDGLDFDGARTAILDALAKHTPSLLVLDPRLRDARGPHAFEGVQEMDAGELYETLLNRVALTLVNERSFDVYRSVRPSASVALKRCIDLLFSSVLLLVSVLLVPFVFCAVRLESRGPLFIAQERIGKNGVPIRIWKFRTMTKNEHSSAAWVGESDNRVTRVGSFLRRTSIDELPQILAVFVGYLSLIGPRSDIRGLAERLEKEIPLYSLRYSVVPGISGWAQVNQRYAPGNISPQSIAETRMRLQYDLYYIKHYSLLLDLSITLKTVRTLLSRIIPI
jgi:exopolysaccharide biosynthesis polyprenyl glycosylphosphotransferase